MEKKVICFEKVHSEERGQSSQSSYIVEKGNRVDSGYPVAKGHHFMEKSFPVEKPSSSGPAPNMPVPKTMQNIRENRVGSDTSTVPQIPHQNVAGTVNTAQSVQAGKARMRVEVA
ncbi:hypothetical protein U0070_015478 [Myodes glareolus]|uniref:Uncharacterized protein n=1 Tax=Myodes glareolus TaxID=447135 RepID=A0AAW0H4P9_MYOGA